VWDKNTTRCNSSQFLDKNIPDLNAMICYPIVAFQDDFNSARPLWSFTNDMDHQGFYGTCYVKPRPVSFAGFPLLPSPQETKFQFFDKCIPCDNIGQDLNNPRWGPQQKYCTDCKVYPAAAPRQQPIVTWTFVANGTFTAPAHWLSPGGSPYAIMNECKMLALRDPKCSKFVMYSDVRAQGLLRNTLKINNTASFAPIVTSSVAGGWHYSNISMGAFPYYKTCACLDKDPLNEVPNFVPPVDVNSTTMACTGGGINPNGCTVRGFVVYKLE
jgi:hypothetical protein